MQVASRSDRGRVLVTGIEGFTGLYLAPLLQQSGYQVIRAVQPEFDLQHPESIIRTIERAQPDFVIHLAGISFVAHDDATAMYAVNTVGTSSLLTALERVAPRVRKVMLASTSQVYGNSNDDPIREHTLAAPVSHYACSKLSMELMARTWFDRLPIIITRPFNYIGRGQAKHFLLPKIVDHFQRKAPVIELGNIDVERDFLDVRSIADIYVRLLQTQIAGEVLNIASGIGRSLRSIIDCASTITGHKIDLAVSPAYIRSNEVTRLVGSNERLVGAIGPLRPIKFETTLRWMLQGEDVEAAKAQR